MDTILYWKLVRKLERELVASHPNGAVHLASVEKADTGLPGGVISVATTYVAAKAITDRKSVLATPEQIKEYQAENERRAALIGAQSRRLARTNRRGGGVVYEL